MNNRFFTRFILLFLFISVSLKVAAKIILPALIADNMVLQQQSKPALWGGASANAQLTIITSWNKKLYSAKADKEGNWKINILTLSAGGPYEITISDGEKVIIKNVMIGEVWFCSGQSNMEMALRGNSSPILNANEIILNADNTSLRLFTIKTQASLTPQTNLKGGQW
jgi:sialate O-acetylesterase